MKEQDFSGRANNDGAPLWFQKVSRPVQRFTYTALTLAGLVSAACTGGGNSVVESPSNQGSQPTITSGKSVDEIPERVLPISGLAYLTQGEHAWDDSSTGVMSSIDVAPIQGGRCPANGARFAIEDQDYVSMVSGRVVAVGDQTNRNDSLHSVVRVQEDKTGLVFEHMHDDEIPQDIKVGEHVTTGQKIGKVSCEVPHGGLSTGPHAHVDVLAANVDVSDILAERLPIRGMVFSGWKVNGDELIQGQDVRFANEGRCGPENSIRISSCDGKRNDLSTVKAELATPYPTVTPIVPVPTVEAKSPGLTLAPAEKKPEYPAGKGGLKLRILNADGVPFKKPVQALLFEQKEGVDGKPVLGNSIQTGWSVGDGANGEDLFVAKPGKYIAIFPSIVGPQFAKGVDGSGVVNLDVHQGETNAVDIKLARINLRVLGPNGKSYIYGWFRVSGVSTEDHQADGSFSFNLLGGDYANVDYSYLSYTVNVGKVSLSPGETLNMSCQTHESKDQFALTTTADCTSSSTE